MIAAILSLAAATASPAPAPSPYPLDALLAKPVTPGVVALLVSHVGDPRAVKMVTDALAHEDAVVRGAAARVAAATGLAAASAAVWTAVARETDAATAAELIHAAVVLTPPERHLELTPIAARHGVLMALGEAIAAVRGPGALPQIDRLIEAGMAKDASGDLTTLATRWGREGLSVAGAAALRSGDADRWATVLALARQPGAVLGPGLIVAALRSKDADVRAETYWHLALTLPEGKALAADVEAAIAEGRDAAGPAADVGAAFALAALRREQTGKREGRDWADRLARGQARIPLDVHGFPEPIRALLTKGEARALSRAITSGVSDDVLEDRRAPYPPLVVSRRMIAAGVTGALVRSVLTATGCEPKEGLRAAAVVEHHPDGRPRRVSIAEVPEPPACAQAAIPFLALARSPKDVLPTTPRTVLVVTMDPEAIACAESRGPFPIRSVTPDSFSGPRKVTEPRKVRTVNPVYPEQALRAGRSGLVLMRGVIAESGCIQSLDVVKSAAPDLDHEALVAVSGWQYTPTLLDGKAVPVYMTITVNFRGVY